MTKALCGTCSLPDQTFDVFFCEGLLVLEVLPPLRDRVADAGAVSQRSPFGDTGAAGPVSVHARTSANHSLVTCNSYIDLEGHTGHRHRL